MDLFHGDRSGHGLMANNRNITSRPTTVRVYDYTFIIVCVCVRTVIYTDAIQNVFDNDIFDGPGKIQ